MGSGACRNAGSPASAEPVSASEAVSAAVFGAQPAQNQDQVEDLRLSRSPTGRLSVLFDPPGQPGGLYRTRRSAAFPAGVGTDHSFLLSSVPSTSLSYLAGSLQRSGLMPNPRHNPSVTWEDRSSEQASIAIKLLTRFWGSLEVAETRMMLRDPEMRYGVSGSSANCLQWVDSLLKVPDFSISLIDYQTLNY